MSSVRGVCLSTLTTKVVIMSQVQTSLENFRSMTLELSSIHRSRRKELSWGTSSPAAWATRSLMETTPDRLSSSSTTGAPEILW